MPATWFLKPGFRARSASRSRYDHTQGGPNVHTGASCKICKIPLRLIWTLDTTDPRFEAIPPTKVNNHAQSLARFRKLKRLPLYYCWRCVADISYRLHSPTKIEVLHQTGDPQGTDFPYDDYPEAFPETRLVLERVPPGIETSIQLAHRPGGS